MDKQLLIAGIEKLLERPPGSLKESERLTDLESWDSMAVIGFMAMVNDKFGVSVAPSALHKCETVNDLIELASKNEKA